jgi:phage tail sheath gpL-like
VAQLERMITTYETSPSGAADTSYLDVTTMLTLIYLRYSCARGSEQVPAPQARGRRHGRRLRAGHRDAEARQGRGRGVVRGHVRARARRESSTSSSATWSVERNTQDPNRLDFLLPPDLINQLMVTGTQMQFRL